MLGERLKAVVLSDAAVAFGDSQAKLLANYLELSEERVPVSVWVDLFEIAHDEASLTRHDPEGTIRARVHQGEVPGFFDWWSIEAPVRTLLTYPQQLVLFN